MTGNRGTDTPADSDTAEGSPKRSSFSGTVALLCIASAAISATVIASVFYQPVPPSLVTASDPVEMRLVEEELTDTRLVELSVVLGDTSFVASPRSGRITSMSCVAGDSLVSGASTFAIDGTPLLNLHTSTPLWRDLWLGATGEDVAALQRELARLGHSVAETAQFDLQTWAAWDSQVAAIGGDAEYGSLALAEMLWLPAVETGMESCPAGIGQNVSQNEALVHLAAPILSAAAQNYPADLVPGARKFVLDGVDLEADESGRLTVAGLAALSATDAFARYSQNPSDASLQAELVLTESITVYPVAPAAIAMTGGSSGCVVTTNGTSEAVTVVASKLGRSYIAFENEPRAGTSIKLRSDKATTCS